MPRLALRVSIGCRLLLIMSSISLLGCADANQGVKLADYSFAGGVKGLAFVDGGKALLTADMNGTVKSWDAGSGQQLGMPLQGRGPIDLMTASSDGQLIMLEDPKAGIQLWDSATGQEIRLPDLKPAHCAALSPDGRLLVIADVIFAMRETKGVDARPAVWDIRQRRVIERLQPKFFVDVLQFSADGQTFVTAGRRSESFHVTSWDTRTWEPIPEGGYRRRRGYVNQAAISSNGHWIAMQTGKGVELVDVSNSAKSNGSVYLLVAAGGNINLAFTKDSKTLIASCVNYMIERGKPTTSNIYFWDTMTRKELKVIHVTGQMLSRLAVAPDDSMIATAGHLDGHGPTIIDQVKLWPIRILAR
jgi:WD40 repeat protein